MGYLLKDKKDLEKNKDQTSLFDTLNCGVDNPVSPTLLKKEYKKEYKKQFKKEIDKDMFEKLCALFCIKGEIAGIFEVAEDVVENFCLTVYKKSFDEVFDFFSSKGKLSLRRKLYEKAMAGDTRVLIFLSKNYLGLSENLNIQVDQRKNFELEYPTFDAEYEKKPDAQ